MNSYQRPVAERALPAEDAPVRRSRRFPLSTVPVLVVAFDMASITLSAVVSYFLWVQFNPVTLEYYLFCAAFIVFVTIELMSRAEMYRMSSIMRPVKESDYLIVAVVTSFLLFLTIVVALRADAIYSRAWLWSFAGLSIVTLVANRLSVAHLLKALGRKRWVGRSVVVLGTGRQAEQFLSRLGRISPFFTTVEGVFAVGEAERPILVAGHPVRGGFDDMLRFVRERPVDDVIVALPWAEDERVGATVEALSELPVNVAVSTDLAGFRLAFRPVMGHIADLPVFEVVQRPISGTSSLLKALEDYVISILVLVALAPLLLLTAIAIKLDSPGPVLFRQQRLGFNNQMFWIYKFRSMYHRPHPEKVTRQASRCDPRVTRIGRLIRATSIDELPQLVNVLNGTMSLVGPRPHALDHNANYGRQIRGYFARHKVKPGITGWAQVNGLRGGTEDLAEMEARVRHDIHYAENWSLLFDLRILVMTMVVVLTRKNAY